MASVTKNLIQAVSRKPRFFYADFYLNCFHFPLSVWLANAQPKPKRKAGGILELIIMECVSEEQSLVRQPLRGPLIVLIRPLVHAQVMHQNALALKARFLFLIQVIHFIGGQGGVLT